MAAAVAISSCIAGSFPFLLKRFSLNEAPVAYTTDADGPEIIRRRAIISDHVSIFSLSSRKPDLARVVVCDEVRGRPRKSMERVIIHWTAGGPSASDVDKWHYHWIIQQDLRVVEGDEGVTDNVVTGDGDYAAHTLRLNTGSIGVALDGMHGARERPFSPVGFPITERQLEMTAQVVAGICTKYKIPVTRETVLTHAEVEPTLKVPQRAKWDIARLPWRSDLKGAIRVGDFIRELVLDAIDDVVIEPDTLPTISCGDTGRAVKILYRALGLDDRDGYFSEKTERQVRVFQKEQRLMIDGIAGPETWGELSHQGRLT